MLIMRPKVRFCVAAASKCSFECNSIVTFIPFYLNYIQCSIVNIKRTPYIIKYNWKNLNLICIAFYSNMFIVFENKARSGCLIVTECVSDIYTSPTWSIECNRGFGITICKDLSSLFCRVFIPSFSNKLCTLSLPSPIQISIRLSWKFVVFLGLFEDFC